MGLLSRALGRWRTPPIELPAETFDAPWEWVPFKPYLIVDVEWHTQKIVGLSSTSSLNKACAEFGKRLGPHPIVDLHAVVDAKARVILGAQPVKGQEYGGCAAAWFLMDRHINPVDAAIYESSRARKLCGMTCLI